MRSAAFRFLPLLLLTAISSCVPSADTDEIWQSFSGEKALGYVAELVAIGPRPAGSEALEKSRQYIIRELESFGWTVDRQTFESPTPRGPVTFTNLIATRDPVDGGRIILASHYDTKLFDDFAFVGANDAGSSTAVLIEMARVLSATPKLASRCELIFFDGEECFIEYNDNDGLYGSRYFANEIQSPNQTAIYQCGILLDMVGDRHLRLTLPVDSPRPLLKTVFASAEALGIRDTISLSSNSILDDHVPINKIGIPMIDLIDFDFPAWHTPDDTLDKVSADSLQTVGQLTLHALTTLAAEK